MAYIGNIPAESYASFETETFSVSATANYTLSHAVTNENEIRLVINGVVQQPGSGKAYTASGTTLTLTSATVSGDSMYAVYLGRALQTVNPPNASVGLSQLSATGTKNSTTFLRGDNTFASAGGDMTPAFEAYVGSIQTGLSSGTWTKIAANTEVYDTDSNYDTSNYRFTPTTAGKYLVYVNVSEGSASDYQMWGAHMAIYKNGSAVKMHSNNFNPSYDHNEASLFLSSVIDMNGSSDYVEPYARVYTGSGNWNIFTEAGGAKLSWFGAYKIIE